MDGIELRSEILSGDTKYYIQSNVVANQSSIVTSLFHEGTLLSTQTDRYDAAITPEALKQSVRGIHEERRTRITSLLDLRGQLKQDVDSRAHLKLGEALYKQRLFKEAMAEVIRSIKLGLEDSRGYSILGNCLLSTGDHEKALKAFQKGIDITPDYPDLYNDLGTIYMVLERCRDAVLSFEKAVSLNKYYQAAILNLAVALAQNVVLKQDYELSRDLGKKMREILKMNLQLNPSLNTDSFRDAERAVDQEDYETVYRKLTMIREEQIRAAQADLSLELYLIMKFRAETISEEEIDRFIERIQAALVTHPGYADLRNDLGLLYAAKCKIFIDKANASFADALKANSKFKKAEKNLKLAANDKQGIHFLLRALLD